MDLQLAAPIDDTVASAEPVPAAQEPSASACLLEYAPGVMVALPIHAGVELVEQPSVVPVPGMPSFALGLMAWQGRQLPLIDLQRYLGEEGGGECGPSLHVLVVAYQTGAGQALAYGALCAPFLVRMVEVIDRQQCPLPEDRPSWREVSVSCFSEQGKAVPVLDLSRVFVNNRSKSRLSTVHIKGGHNHGSEFSGDAETQ